MVTGPLVLGIDRTGNGDNCLFAHLDLTVRQFQLFLHLPLMALDQQPCHPAHCKHRNRKHIEDEPVVVVHLLFFRDVVGTLNNDVLLVVVENSQAEHIVPRGQVGIGNGTQGVLRNNGPVRVEAIQHIADVRILDRVVDHFRQDLQAADAPRDLLGHAAIHPVDRTVHFDGGNAHPVHLGPGGKAVGVDHKHAGVAGQVQVAVLSVEPGPGVGGQAAVQPAPGIQQIIGDFILAAEQLIPVHGIDTGAAQHKQAVRSLDPDIIVVEIREVVQLADGFIRVHVAKAVACHHKDAAGLGVRHRPEDHLTAQAVDPGQHPDHVAVLNHCQAVSVRTGQDLSVRKFRNGQHHAADPVFRVNDGVFDPVVPDIAQSRIAGREDRTVPQLGHHPRPVSERAVIPIIHIFRSVRIKLCKAVAIGADPQVALVIHCHAADPDSAEPLGDLVLDPVHSPLVHRVHALVRADVIYAVPLGHGIDHPFFHTGSGIDIPEV